MSICMISVWKRSQEKVCLTASYVSFIFKKETGYNLVKYLTDYRMKKAKELLEESNWKIVDIGKACGYTNQPYFNKLFKKLLWCDTEAVP